MSSFIKFLICAFCIFVSGASVASSTDAIPNVAQEVKAPEQLKYEAEAKKEEEQLYEKLINGVAEEKAVDMFDLATLYEQGRTRIPIDLNAAYDLYERAADNGYRLALQKVCRAYLLGQNRPKNIAKGMGYCNKLGAKDAVGLFLVGFDYQYGLSGPADENMALSIYKDAVELGSGDAADALGQKALSQDNFAAAIEWFRYGIYFGSVNALDHFAQMRELGQGGDKDEIESNWLYYYAAIRGNAHAIEKGGIALKDRFPKAIATKNKEKWIDLSILTKDNKVKNTNLHQILSQVGEGAVDNLRDDQLTQKIDATVAISCYINSNNKIDGRIQI